MRSAEVAAVLTLMTAVLGVAAIATGQRESRTSRDLKSVNTRLDGVTKNIAEMYRVDSVVGSSKHQRYCRKPKVKRKSYGKQKADLIPILLKKLLPDKHAPRRYAGRI